MDPLEYEADRIADQVSATPVDSAVSATPASIQRNAGNASEGVDTAPASVDRVLETPGRPLAPMLLHDMEHRFGHDFSRVRVHSGTLAERSAKEMNATAYTVGDNIVFGAGRFAPETQAGRRLIAHELTHTLQQSPSRGFNTEVRLQQSPDSAPKGQSFVVQQTGSAAQGVTREESADDLETIRSKLLDHLFAVQAEHPVSFGTYLQKNEELLRTALGDFGYAGCYVKAEMYVPEFDEAVRRWATRRRLAPAGDGQAPAVRRMPRSQYLEGRIIYATDPEGGFHSRYERGTAADLDALQQAENEQGSAMMGQGLMTAAGGVAMARGGGGNTPAPVMKTRPETRAPTYMPRGPVAGPNELRMDTTRPSFTTPPVRGGSPPAPAAAKPATEPTRTTGPSAPVPRPLQGGGGGNAGRSAQAAGPGPNREIPETPAGSKAPPAEEAAPNAKPAGADGSFLGPEWAGKPIRFNYGGEGEKIGWVDVNDFRGSRLSPDQVARKNPTGTVLRADVENLAMVPDNSVDEIGSQMFNPGPGKMDSIAPKMASEAVRVLKSGGVARINCTNELFREGTAARAAFEKAGFTISSPKSAVLKK